MPLPAGGLTKDELLTHYGTSRQELEPGASFWVVGKQEAADEGGSVSKEGWLRVLGTCEWGQYRRDIPPPELARFIKQRDEYALEVLATRRMLRRIPRWIRWLFKAL
jgi:hypothetical protein